MLKVQLLTETAKAPTVANPGEDIAYDLYSDQDATILPGQMEMVSTGVAIEFKPAAGAILKDRSSMAKLYALTVGGVIDAGYRGEVKVMMHNRHDAATLVIKKGEKVCQMVKAPVVRDKVKVVKELTSSKRGEKGFGSSGK